MLINCVAYQDGKKIADITVDDISEYLKLQGCFVWVALADADAAELTQMQEEFGLHDLAIEDARKGHQRPKIEEYGHTVFVVVHVVELQGERLQVGELHLFAGPNFVLSLRNRSARDFRGVRARCESEPELLRQGSGFVLYAMIDEVVDRYFPIVESLENDIEKIEESVFGGGAGRAVTQRLYELKRCVGRLKHAVLPLLDAMSRLAGNRVPLVCMHSQEYFRDVIDHLARVNASVDTIRETLTTAMQVNLSLVTIEDSETTKRLAAYAGIFAVATFLVGVWGMNFKYMPELDWKWGYPAALATIASTCALVYWRFRRLRWL